MECNRHRFTTKDTLKLNTGTGIAEQQQQNSQSNSRYQQLEDSVTELSCRTFTTLMWKVAGGHVVLKNGQELVTLEERHLRQVPTVSGTATCLRQHKVHRVGSGKLALLQLIGCIIIKGIGKLETFTRPCGCIGGRAVPWRCSQVICDIMNAVVHSLPS